MQVEYVLYTIIGIYKKNVYTILDKVYVAYKENSWHTLESDETNAWLYKKNTWYIQGVYFTPIKKLNEVYCAFIFPTHDKTLCIRE